LRAARSSRPFRRHRWKKDVDARHKAGHDDQERS
jgi:hypothetical protein